MEDKNTTAPTTQVEPAKVAPTETSSQPVSPTLTSARQFDKTFTELKAIQSTVKKFKPGDIVIPLLSLISLGLLTAFVYIPMITSGLKFRDESKGIDQKMTQLKALDKNLDGIDLANLQNDISNARSVIPFSLQVSDFVGYVDDAAKSKKLIFKEILAGDIVVRNSTDNKGIDSVIRGVSGPLKYNGTLSQISDFLDEVQDTSPFIISTDQVKLKRGTTVDTWELALTVTGYYLNQASIPKLDIYAPFTNYSQYKDVVDVFTTKSQKLGTN